MLAQIDDNHLWPSSGNRIFWLLVLSDDATFLTLSLTLRIFVNCNPIFSMAESADAIDDSDDEVDYTKMDQGNKKGPIGRWDFDTQEEYSSYMSNKEALPK